MSIRTIAEFNHDCTHAIADHPEEFVKLLTWYMKGCDREIAEELSARFGLTLLPACHHSTDRKAVIYGTEYPL